MYVQVLWVKSCDPSALVAIGFKHFTNKPYLEPKHALKPSTLAQTLIGCRPLIGFMHSSNCCICYLTARPCRFLFCYCLFALHFHKHVCSFWFAPADFLFCYCLFALHFHKHVCSFWFAPADFYFAIACSHFTSTSTFAVFGSTLTSTLLGHSILHTACGHSSATKGGRSS